MTRKILTLFINNVPTQYYIDFEKDRKQFNLQPVLSGASAPSFRIIERYGVLIEVEETDPELIEQAKQKITEILSDPKVD
jgi:hypothetical protein